MVKRWISNGFVLYLMTSINIVRSSNRDLSIKVKIVEKMDRKGHLKRKRKCHRKRNKENHWL